MGLPSIVPLQPRANLARSPAALPFPAFLRSIVLPDRNFSPEQLRHAFTHELAHYRRHDNLLKWVSVLAVCVNWFNPVIYFAVREAGRQCELACDETVTAKFSREERISYGKTLLAVASGSNHPFALSATMSEEKRNLKERLEVLAKAKNRGKKAVVLSVSLFSIAVILTAGTLMVSCANSPVSSAQASTSDSANTSGSGNSSVPSAASSNTPSESQLDNFVSYAQNHGFKTLTNSSIAGFIQLPSSFSGTVNDFDIGAFLGDRNALSKQNGFDFSGYTGKVLTVYACDGEKRQPGDSELTEVDGGPDTVCIVGLYDGEKIVGFWSHGFSDKDDDFSILSNYLKYVPSSPAGYSSNADYSAQIVDTVSSAWKAKYSDISITNEWISAVAEIDVRYVALAGELKSDPRQGIVEVVTAHRDGTTVKSDQRFLCPQKDGSLTVTEIGAKDTTMGLRDAAGSTWNFDIFNGFDPQTPVSSDISSSGLKLDDLKIGKLFIGQSLSEVQKDFGEPKVKTIVHGNGGPQWEYTNPKFTVGGDPVFTIDVSSEDLGSTPKGIHVGSTEQELHQAYPSVEWTQNHTQADVQSKDARGFTQLDIGFFISNGKVGRIIMTNENP